jgi:hypothetical protein
MRFGMQQQLLAVVFVVVLTGIAWTAVRHGNAFERRKSGFGSESIHDIKVSFTSILQ